MPQLNKIRIVNFRYNDGKRIIADEIFSFEGSEGKNFNTLITLANGGGKSVLVQAALQPLLPKARVAGRKIESFFRRPSDHFFVVLEWAKDDSRERLLTGIAMKASESASDNDGEVKLGVSFYLFCLNASDSDGRYSLKGLPLSRFESGAFKAQDYLDFRKFLKNGKERIFYVSDNDRQWKTVWQDKLREFGLSSHEWQMIEKLNSDEGGMGKFFEKFRSSDAVIDDLLIDCIEHGAEINGDKLSNLLFGYVNKYKEHESDIRREKALSSLIGELKEHEHCARECWDKGDKRDIGLEKLFLFQDALLQLREKQAAECEALKAALEERRQQLKQIEWEKASDRYYRSWDAKAKAEADRDEAAKRLEELKARLKEVKHQLDVLFCADQFGLLKKKYSEIEGLNKAIADKENENAGSSELKSLKFSVWIKTSRLIPEQEQNNDRLQSEIKEQQKLSAELAEKLNSAEKTFEDLRREADNLSGRAEERSERIKGALDRLGLGTEDYQSLLNEYDLELLGQIRNNWESGKAALEAQRSDSEVKRRSCEEKLEGLEAEKDALTKKQYAADSDLKNTERELAEFERSRSIIEDVFKRHGLPLSEAEGVFSRSLQSFLDEEIKDRKSRQASLLLADTLKSELIEAVKRGHVHVPGAVINYLDQSGIEYETFEHRLQQYIKNGGMTAEEVGAVLENYPPAAYGLVLSESGKEKLERYCRENRAEWLPAMVPLFTDKQTENVLKMEDKRFPALAFYSREYFASRESYQRKLSEELGELRERADKNKAALAALQKDRQSVYEFLNRYNQAWLEAKLSERKRLLGERAECAEALDKLKSDRKRLKAEAEALTGKIKDLDGAIRDRKDKIVRLAEIEGEIGQYDKLLGECRDKKAERDKCERELKALRERLEALKRDINSLEADFKQQEQLLQKLREAESATAGAPETEIRSGEWQELYRQYQTLSAAQYEAVEFLRRQLEDKQKEAADIQRKLDNRQKQSDVKREEYENCIFSEKKREIFEAENRKLEADREESEDSIRSLAEQFGKTKSDLNSAERALAEYGGQPVPRREVKADFDKRIKEAKQRIREREKEAEQAEDKRNRAARAAERTEDYLSVRSRRSIKADLVLDEEDYSRQWKALRGEFEELESAYAKADGEEREKFLNFCSRHESGDLLPNNEFRELKGIFGGGGDVYYNLMTRLEVCLSFCERERVRLNADLEDFDKQKQDAVRKFWEHGRKLYEDLKKMADASRVKLDKTYRPLLKIGIPESVDDNISRSRIESEFDKCVEELAAKLKNTDIGEEKLREECRRISAGSKLLRTYIDRREISLQAYKFEHNINTGVYRAWADVQTKNSGAEKFLVYFAIVLSLMRYARQAQYSEISSSKKYGVLILDNPFGAASSAHIIKPMFDMAKHFKVQLVCLSDITKSDVVTCFDKVIKAVVRPLPSSSMEKLVQSADGDNAEALEYGYYQKELLW